MFHLRYLSLLGDRALFQAPLTLQPCLIYRPTLKSCHPRSSWRSTKKPAQCIEVGIMSILASSSIVLGARTFLLVPFLAAFCSFVSTCRAPTCCSTLSCSSFASATPPARLAHLQVLHDECFRAKRPKTSQEGSFLHIFR